jgi:hypothetical protein
VLWKTSQNRAERFVSDLNTKAQFSGHKTLICLPENQSQFANIIQIYAKVKQSAPQLSHQQYLSIVQSFPLHSAGKQRNAA